MDTSGINEAGVDLEIEVEEGEHKIVMEPTTDIIGKLVWCPDEDYAWITAMVKRFQVVEQKRLNDALEIEYEVEVTKTRQRKRFLRSEVQSYDISHSLDLENVCMMNDMQEAPLLDLLRRRFQKKKIYTYAGGILISLNPYESIAGLYQDPRRFFSLKKLPSPEILAITGGKDGTVDQTPHVYQIANNALRALTHESDGSAYQDQSVIISGESGAGKTENSKHVINFFIESNNFFSNETHDSNEESFADELKQILIQSSVVLEAFGNAKTVRNDNSSRFGKYIKLLYTPQVKADNSHEIYPKLVSAKTETFLLEKSRLTNIGRSERSYHIFHQLMLGLDDISLRNELCLTGDASNYRLLSEGECKINQADTEEYKLTLQALRSLQCSRDEIKEIIRLLGVIIQLRNLEISSDDETAGTISIHSPSYTIEQVAKQLGVHVENLKIGFTMNTVKVRGRASVTSKRLSVDEVANNVNALLKVLYSKLFDWIVRKINYCHSSVYTTRQATTNFIGILDIFGFEILRTNSFEQLCINFTNERLQQQFNQHVFVTEQEMYKAEGLEWLSIGYRDNQPVIDVISSPKKPQGLLLLLEEQGMLNRKPDDMALLSIFNQTHHVQLPSTTLGNSPYKAAITAAAAANIIYSKARFGNSAFTLKHFAGEVTYSIEGFLIKNNDSLQDDLMSALRETNNEFLQHVMQFGLAIPGGLGYIPEDVTAAAVMAPSTPIAVTAAAAAAVTSPMSPTSASTTTGAVTPMSSGRFKMASAASVSLHFRAQLDTLMSTLYNTAPHYIKCIKSNNVKQAGEFEASLVIQQLRYSGVLEVVRIRREGFPMRMTFHEFYNKYSVLLIGQKSTKQNEIDFRKECQEILQVAKVGDMVQAGHSLIFLRDRGITAMQDVITTFFTLRAVRIQTKYRMILARKRYVHIRNMIVIVKSYLQMIPRRKQYLTIRKNAIRIQAFYISKMLRSKFMIAIRRKLAAIVIQTCIRGALARNWYLKLLVRTLCMQSLIRCYLQRSRYKRIKKRAVALQARIRAFIEQSRYHRTIWIITRLQAWMRMAPRMKDYQEIYHVILRVQSWYRAWRQVKRYQKIVKQVIKLQSIVRTIVCLNAYHLQYAAILALQSFARKIIAQTRFELCLASILSLQTTFRKFRAMIRLQRMKKSVVVMQKIIRGHLSRRLCQALRAAILCIQSMGRMIIARNRYNLLMISTITLQAFVRSCLAYKRYRRTVSILIKMQACRRRSSINRHYQATRKSTLRLQSFGRMIIARNHYSLMLISAISIQTVFRRAVLRRKYVSMRTNVIKLQALFRMSPKKWSHKLSLKAVVIAVKYVRRWRARTAYMKLKYSTLRSQRAVKAFLRNQELHRRLKKLHEPLPNQQLLITNPEDRMIRYLFDGRDLRTVLQSQLLMWRSFLPQASSTSASAVATAAVAETITAVADTKHRLSEQDIIQRLNIFMPSGPDCFAVDRYGRSTAHYISMVPSMILLQYLVQVIDNHEYALKAQQMEALDEEDDENATSSNNLNAAVAAGQTKETARTRIVQMVAESVNRSKLRQGWLKKKRGGLMWQKRWVILTEDYIIYYSSNTTTNAPKFAIPLEGCTVQRVTGTRDPVFELYAPNMVEKKSFFGSSSKKSLAFLAESEQEMQEWLTPLRAVAGVDKLRVGPVTYLKLELRQLWLNMTDKRGDTPLHTLMRHATEHSDSGIEEAVRLFGWMTEHGAVINAQNVDGDTPLHVALGLKVDRRLVRVLFLKGADPKGIKNNSGRTALQMLPAEDMNRYKDEFAIAITSAAKPNVPFVGKIKGYSYLTLYFTQQDFASDRASLTDQPSLTISAMNSKRQLIEPAKELRGPALIQLQSSTGSKKKVYWAVSWHMQTPLENLDAGSFILIEYRARAPSGNEKAASSVDAAATSVVQLPLERESIDSSDIKLQFSGSIEAGSKVVSPTAVVAAAVAQERSTLRTTIILSRKPRDIKLADVLA